MAFDYVLPGWLCKILRKPSERTQLESTLIGILIMMISSLGVASYMVGFYEMSIWVKLLIAFGEVGILFFQGSLLVTTYIQYYTLKTALGLYPKDYTLQIKINEAKSLVKELREIIKYEK